MALKKESGFAFGESALAIFLKRRNLLIQFADFHIIHASHFAFFNEQTVWRNAQRSSKSLYNKNRQVNRALLHPAQIRLIQAGIKTERFLGQPTLFDETL